MASSSVSPVTTVQEKGSRNKRKFRADPPPPAGSQNIISQNQHECLSYEFSAEKFETPGHSNGCDMCSFNHENADSLKLDLGLSCAAVGLGSSEVVANRNREELEPNDEFHDADWSDLTESQLEELVLANLDAMFKTAIKKIVSFGYTEEVATKAVLRPGLCCGCKDTISNIVENTLIYLKNQQDTDPLKEHHFENLQQMEKYTLAELVCVLREVRPFFSTGDAMWCLLISDMNVSHACAIDSDAASISNGGSTNSKESKNSGTLPNPCKSNHSSLSSPSSPHTFPLQPPPPVMASIPCVHNSKPNPPFFSSQKGNQNHTRPLTLSSQTHEEKPLGSRKISGISKRDYILRQKSIHLDKTYRSHGLKSGSRAGKSNINGLLLDKKLKSVSESTNLKNPETELSLSFTATPQDKKDETVMKLVPRVRELQTQLQEWTEWANQKVMQAARRLGKDKTELKTLKQEKEEVERLKKEKQTLEENTMKKLSEMENALCKASAQVGRANSAVCRLEVENGNLRLEMEAANLQAAESAASCREVAKREKKTLMQLQVWEKHKMLFQEELLGEKRKLAQLQEDLGVAKEQRDQLEARWKQEEKGKEELTSEAIKYRIARQEGELSSKSREDLTRLKADKNLQKYKTEIQKLEKEISALRLKSDSSKIAALRKGIDGSYASKLSATKTTTTAALALSDSDDVDISGDGGGVERERECVMCLSEEMSVVFLPCAHQVVCTKCNELHEKQGMKDCPSCRGPIQRRINVRYGLP